MINATHAIASHIESGKTITALEALDLFQCNRLAARVNDLRRRGLAITSKMIRLPNGKRIAQYFKAVPVPAEPS